jgi:hypothetical protein
LGLLIAYWETVRFGGDDYFEGTDATGLEQSEYEQSKSKSRRVGST